MKTITTIERLWTTIFLAALLGIFAVTGCTTRTDELPQETPIPPSALMDLPRAAKIRDPRTDCEQLAVNIFEFPGVEPLDPNSAYQGHTGKNLGSLRACTAVTITDYAWSEFDQEFWVYVKTEDLEGWVWLEDVDVEP